MPSPDEAVAAKILAIAVNAGAPDQTKCTERKK
jgi:hypothetical protein